LLKNFVPIPTRAATRAAPTGDVIMYDSEIHHRRSIRLKYHDYQQKGVAYFLTICLQNRTCLLGNVVDGCMQLNDAGQMIGRCWERLPDRFCDITLDAYVVMPNHFHAILQIEEGHAEPKQRFNLGNIIGAFKSLTTHAYIHGVKNEGWAVFDKRLWQKNYYEHIIRNERSLENIREYILGNPINWEQDELYSTL